MPNSMRWTTSSGLPSKPSGRRRGKWGCHSLLQLSTHQSEYSSSLNTVAHPCISFTSSHDLMLCPQSRSHSCKISCDTGTDVNSGKIELIDYLNSQVKIPFNERLNNFTSSPDSLSIIPNSNGGLSVSLKDQVFMEMKMDYELDAQTVEEKHLEERTIDDLSFVSMQKRGSVYDISQGNRRLFTRLPGSSREVAPSWSMNGPSWPVFLLLACVAPSSTEKIHSWYGKVALVLPGRCYPAVICITVLVVPTFEEIS
eukprot:Gb_12616 [translate_table: standard]